VTGIVVPPSTNGLRPSGTTATFLRARFACTDDEVLRAERKLPPNQVYPGIDPARAGDVCESLQPRLSLSEPELRKMVLVRPQVLGCSFVDTIAPKLAALQSRLSLSDAELKKLVMKHSQMLGYSFEAKMKPLLAALQSRLSLSEPELKKFVLRLPQVLSLSLEANIEPALAALELRLSLSGPQLKKLVLDHPAVLSYSFKANIEPKLTFLQTAFGLAPDELRERVLANPALLFRSLEQRYCPRVVLASALGLLVARETLNPAGMYTDEKFMAWMRRKGRVRVGLADADWEALCAQPLLERADSVHPVHAMLTC